MDASIKQTKDELLRICWYMRGSISINEAWALSPQDKEIINKIIKDNIETVKKTKLPMI